MTDSILGKLDRDENVRGIENVYFSLDIPVCPTQRKMIKLGERIEGTRKCNKIVVFGRVRHGIAEL